jgi:hypothetical protein
MTEREFDDLKRLLKGALPRVSTEPPKRDLWPAVLQRLDSRPVRVPWWDWALLAGATLLLCLFPGVIPALLYHL